MRARGLSLRPASGRDVLRSLAAWLVERRARWSRRQVGLALVYHKVGDPPGDPRRELVPALGTALFAAQLAHLRRRYRVVPASELPDAVVARRRGRRFPIAITFDDDLASHVTSASPALQAAGLPATFFLCGASLEERCIFWWEALQVVIDERLAAPAELPPLAPGDVEAALAREPGALARLGKAIEALPPAEQDPLTAELVRRAGPRFDEPPFVGEHVRRLATDGFDVGFHTRRHRLLTGLAGEELDDALRDGRTKLEQIAGRRLGALSYPHGKADERVAAAVQGSGYDVAFTGRREPVKPRAQRYLLGRVEPRGDTPGRFARELARELAQRPRRAAR
ncbi:MAG: hypothetical protein QOH73_2628 [Gaiellaceae bacterium]|nr:hypothetical protein [Gaiellaceae bacterium]